MYLKWTTQTVQHQENNSDFTTSDVTTCASGEQVRHYYLKKTTQTLLPQENNSDITTCTSNEQLRRYYLKWTT